jgi:hypothetical protein
MPAVAANHRFEVLCTPSVCLSRTEADFRAVQVRSQPIPAEFADKHRLPLELPATIHLMDTTILP